MANHIFAGLSLTDDIPVRRQPEQAQVPTPQQSPQQTWHGTPQFEPLRETPLCSAAERVRAEAQRLGIDYDAEIAKTLHRMQTGYHAAPHPGDTHAGPDPLKHIAYDKLLQAEAAVNEQIKRGFRLP